MTDHERYRAAVRNAQAAVGEAVMNAEEASSQLAMLLETYGDNLPDEVRRDLASAADDFSLYDSGNNAQSALSAMPRSLPEAS